MAGTTTCPRCKTKGVLVDDKGNIRAHIDPKSGNYCDGT